MRDAFLEVVERGNVPAPDRMLEGDVTYGDQVSEFI
jgi:hypothetical protein